MFEVTTMNVVFIKIKQFFTSSRAKDGIQPQSIVVKQRGQVGSLLTVYNQTENAYQHNWALYIMKPLIQCTFLRV